MNLTRLAISNPVAVIAAILLVLLMGTIAMLSLPVQMIPDVQRSFIQINTGWRSAAPEEVESEIVEPQEDVLRGVPGLEKMESTATRGNANIDLMFSVGTDLQRALIEVINRLNQVPRYPSDVTEPRIFAGQDSFGEQIAWFTLTRVPGNERPMASYEDFVREVVQARIERVPGVSNSNAYGGRANEVRITFDPYEAEQPPTLFHNAPPLRAGEDLVEFYMTPSYWLWDPSSLVFASFALFFAMIVADAGYALLLALIVLAYRRRLGASESGRRWRVMLSVMAAATAVYGALAGSYFGVSPPPGSLLGHLHVLDLGDFTVMMALSVIIGASHIAIANLMNAWRYPRWPQRIPPLGWACAVVGGTVLWGSLQLESQQLGYAGMGLMGVGLLGVVGFSGYGEKPLKRMFTGLTALTGVSGAFGDVLSYLRLFALGLASASLAIAFNDMASDVRAAVPGTGFFLGLLILVLGHSLNFLLSVSSGFIHGLRLNVIEFFKWGVKDEGNPYRPFEKKESN